MKMQINHIPVEDSLSNLQCVLRFLVSFPLFNHFSIIFVFSSGEASFSSLLSLSNLSQNESLKFLKKLNPLAKNAFLLL